jgi:phosphoglycerate dehydrogenase-like enzyme
VIERGPILALGPVDALVTDRLRAFGEIVEAGRDARTLAEVLPEAIGLIARGNSVVDRPLIASAPRLRVIGRSGIGVELVDLAAASARRIPVVVTPGAGSNAVAEGALALILHLVKRLGVLTELVREGRWAERESVELGDLEGATLGIVGLGRIGRRLAELCTVLDMRILAFDPYVDRATAAALGVELTDLARLAASADVISLHAPLTAQTTHLVDAGLLARVRPGTVLVNCGRGGLLDLDAVHAALLDGRLCGVGLDVYEPEPPPPGGHPLFQHPAVVLTPHVLGLSRRGRRRTFEEMADGMAAVLAGGRASNIANPEIYEEA